MVEELNAHLEERWRELIARSASEDAATRTVRAELAASDLLERRIGALRQARCVDPAPPGAARTFSIEGLKTDVRQAVRTLRSSPGFTVAALPVLTLGIGATTAIFSVVDAVVLRALPFADPDRIVAVGERTQAPAGKGVPRGFPARPESIRATPRPSTWFARRTTWTGSPASRCSNRWPRSASAAK